MRSPSRRASIPLVPPLLLASALVSTRAAAEDPPRLKYDQPVRCMSGPTGEPVRVQCEAAQGGATRCLVATNRTPTGDELNRVNECSDRGAAAGTWAELVASGAQIVPATAEVPPGFERAASGHAYQTKFDLRNRIYVGGSWSPTFQGGGPSATDSPFGFGRGQLETGFEMSILSPHGRSRHDFRILEGTAALADLELNGVLFAYDYQHLHRRPALWLTTFIGPPSLHEISPPLGWGVRVLEVTDRPPAFRDTLDVEFAEAHLAYNPWQSSDLYDHVRFEAGADVGEYFEHRGALGGGSEYGVPIGYAGLSTAARGRFSLGQGGLHSLTFDAIYRRPWLLAGALQGFATSRFSGTLAYEGVLVAINDQPITVRLAALAGARGDPAANATSVEYGFNAGMRFSFWAPPRVFEPLPPLEDP